MDLKNAAAVCLISLFSATIVVLIARALDSQAASQLAPQLTAIADELHAIRRQGGMATGPGGAVETAGDALVVYYFHSSFRCPNCVAIESQTKALLDADFAQQLSNEEIVWKTLNFEKPAGKMLAAKFEVKDPVVVLARMKNDEVADWKPLNKVRGLVDNKEAFRKYVRGEIEQMLPSKKSPAPAIPTPSAEAAPSKAPLNIPVP
jgi:hypothetical protein